MGRETEGEFFIDNLLVRTYFIIVMICWTGLAPWEFKSLFAGSLTWVRSVINASLSRAAQALQGVAMKLRKMTGEEDAALRASLLQLVYG